MFKRMILLAAVVAIEAHAHAVLEVKEAPVNSYYKGVVQIAHGCEGKSTQTVRVTIPEGVVGVKPSPKPGWTLEKVQGDYNGPHTYYGQSLTKGVTEIVWRGDLPDDEYDEFVFVGFLTAGLPAGEMLYFPVVQDCEGAEERWVEIPAEGQNVHAMKSPAPGIRLQPAIGGH